MGGGASALEGVMAQSPNRVASDTPALLVEAAIDATIPHRREDLRDAVSVIRRFVLVRLDRDGDGVVIEAAARALGLGERSGRHAPFLRSIRRALDYDLIGLQDHNELAAVSEATLLVRRLLPPLSERLADRLPPGLALEHRRYSLAVHADESPLLRHARQLAHTHQQLGARSAEEAS